jgi:hypothetical protein
MGRTGFRFNWERTRRDNNWKKRVPKKKSGAGILFPDSERHVIRRISVSGPSGLTEKLTSVKGSARNRQKTQQSLISIQVRECVGVVTRLRADDSPKSIGLPVDCHGPPIGSILLVQAGTPIELSTGRFNALQPTRDRPGDLSAANTALVLG